MGIGTVMCLLTAWLMVISWVPLQKNDRPSIPHSIVARYVRSFSGHTGHQW